MSTHLTIAWYCEKLGLEPTDDVLLAAVYLEAKGLRFCVDFGIESACDKAEELYRKRAEKELGGAMTSLVVCTYCDYPDGTLEEYRAQVTSAEILFHLEIIHPFPHPSGLPLSFKFHWMREFATHFREFDRIVFTDGHDVLFMGGTDVAERIPAEVIWGAERNCFPEPELAKFISGVTPWKYVNAGLMSGSPEAILEWLDRAERHQLYGEGTLLDQCWLNRRRTDSPGLIAIDSRTEVFYVVSSTEERGELRMKDGVPWNSRCDSWPCFFHFSGSCPTRNFRALLDGSALELL